mgnify:CR=1 FL=1
MSTEELKKVSEGASKSAVSAGETIDMNDPTVQGILADFKKTNADNDAKINWLINAAKTINDNILALDKDMRELKAYLEQIIRVIQA